MSIAPTIAPHLERVLVLLAYQLDILYTLVVNESMAPEALGDDTRLVHALNSGDSGNIGAVLSVLGTRTWEEGKRGSALKSMDRSHTRARLTTTARLDIVVLDAFPLLGSAGASDGTNSTACRATEMTRRQSQDGFAPGLDMLYR